MNRFLCCFLSIPIFLLSSCEKSGEGRSSAAKQTTPSPSSGLTGAPSPTPEPQVPAAGGADHQTGSTPSGVACDWEVKESYPPQVTGTCDVTQATRQEMPFKLVYPVKKDTLKVTRGGVPAQKQQDYTLSEDGATLTLKASLLDQDKSKIIINFVGEMPSAAQNLHRGYDMSGKEATCPVIATENLMCTMVFGPEDAYAAACKQAGHTAYMCGCHRYLCSQKIAFDASKI
jgi:hypothetical protein